MLLARAETKLSSSLTGLLIAAVPLVGALVVTLTGDRERLGGRRWLGLLVGIGGVAALVGLDVGQVDVVALVEIGLVAVGYAVGPIILSRSLSRPVRPRRRRGVARPDGARLCAVRRDALAVEAAVGARARVRARARDRSAPRSPSSSSSR